MPKRMLDDSILSSPSLAKCSPRAQDAFPRVILLMDDFGCAEANPRVLLGRGWPLRDDVTERDVWRWLEEYVAAGMACLWTEKERRWVHLTGWFGPHGQRRRVEYDASTVQGQKGSKRRTPVPPEELVAAVVAGVRRDHDGRPPGVDREEQDPAALPPGNPRDGNPSNPGPARETRGNPPGNTETRSLPAPAVPVAVAVPVAGTTSPAREPVSKAAPPPAARLSPLPRRDERFAERFPATAELLDTLDGLGFRAEWPRDDVSRRAVESATVAATVPIAAARVMAVVERERAAGNEPRPWLGWHLKAISPDKRDVRVGMADPGKPEDFEEGEHELRM